MTEPQAPPQNLDAEERILGAMMVNKHAITAVADKVRPEDFYRTSHAAIFRAALSMDERGEPVDAVTLADELDRRGDLANVGGKVRIHELAALVPATANVGRYAEIVKEVAQRRKLISAGQQITRLGWEGNGTTDELLSAAENHFTDATTTAFTGDFISLGDALADWTAKLREAVETGKPFFGHKTDFYDLDKLLLGLHPGRLYVLAARPSVGKSALGQNIAENFANRGKPAAIFTLEMSKDEVAQRSLCRATSIDPRKIATGRLTTEELQQLEVATKKMSDRPLFVEDNPSITMTELRSRARRHKNKHGLDFLMIDYLQLMVNENASKDARERQVADTARACKILAKELQVPVLLLSQLNRNLEYRENKRPVLADLRESGAIEQDADVVMFLYRESLYKEVEAAKQGDTELIVSKNRQGQTDTLHLLFVGRQQAFKTPARHQEGS